MIMIYLFAFSALSFVKDNMYAERSVSAVVPWPRTQSPEKIWYNDLMNSEEEHVTTSINNNDTCSTIHVQRYMFNDRENNLVTK